MSMTTENSNADPKAYNTPYKAPRDGPEVATPQDHTKEEAKKGKYIPSTWPILHNVFKNRTAEDKIVRTLQRDQNRQQMVLAETLSLQDLSHFSALTEPLDV